MVLFYHETLPVSLFFVSGGRWRRCSDTSIWKLFNTLVRMSAKNHHDPLRGLVEGEGTVICSNVYSLRFHFCYSGFSVAAPIRFQTFFHTKSVYNPVGRHVEPNST